MSDETVGVLDWVSLALVSASAVLGGLLEVMFLAQLFIGTVIVPVVILAALALNIALPVWGARIVHRGVGAVLPVAGWLVTVLALSMYNRPEGDLFVAGLYHMDIAFYGLLFGGAVAGFATVVVITGSPDRQRRRVSP